MLTERRENDQIILEELRDLKQDVKRIDINLALNTQETARLANYQEKQNGRMASHEARMQVVEGAQAITSTAVAAIQASEKDKIEDDDKRREKRSQNYNKLFWIAFGLLLTFLGNVALFVIRSDILKEIFK